MTAGTITMSSSRPSVGAALCHAFAITLAVWCAWFVTHIPWLGVSEKTAIVLILLVWGVAALWSGRGLSIPAAALRGGLSGLIAAVVGLLVLGSKLVKQSSGPAAGEPVPNAAIIALGFLALGTVLGVIGGAMGSRLRAHPHLHGNGESVPPRELWLARFGILAAVAIAPLLFIGGLVTSTNSGMAVPDWPTTFGSSMFLYPLGSDSPPDRYFEHAHRLFGSLVGLITLVLTIYVFAAESRKRLKVLAVVAFLLVCAQGALGGGRVLWGNADALHDNRWIAVLHGVLAQLLFGLVVALAAGLSPTFRRNGVCACGYLRTGLPGGGPLSCPECGRSNPPIPHGLKTYAAFLPECRKLRLLSTALLHSLILQLIFGAMYRHTRSPHALWSHIGFSVVVVILALAAGFLAQSMSTRSTHSNVAPRGIAATLKFVGFGLVVVMCLQFALGWVTFIAGGGELQAGNPLQALIRTLHQANGGLVIAFAALAFVWSRWLWKAASRVESNRPA